MPQRTAGSRLEHFRKMTALHITYLKYVGLWALDSDSSALSKCLYYVYNKFILMIILIFMITLFVDICLSFDDLSVVTDDGCIFAGIFVVFFKVMIFHIRREKIEQLLDEALEGCNRLYKFPIGVEDEIVNKYLMLCRVTFCGVSILGFFLVITLLFFVSVEDGALPVRARYPFDTSKYPGHGIGFFVEACAVSVGMTAILGMDSLHTNLCNLFLVQLAILNAHFKNCSGNGRHDALSGGIDERKNLDAIDRNDRCKIFSEASHEKDNYDQDEIRRGSFAKQFRRSIRNHQRLLAIVDDFNKVFSTSMFVQTFSSTTMICLAGFQATLVTGQSSNTCKFSIYLMAAISQLFYICYVGNEVMHQSALLMQSQWLSKWSDELSVKNGRLLTLSMTFSRKMLNVKAGAFYALSMETFIAILRGSYSFFALLNTMQSEVDQ